MNKEEINKLAQVIHNKIYNENTKFYEQLAYDGKEYSSHVLTENITILDIEKAITTPIDLNKINGLNMQNYIDFDLNNFLTRAIAIRSFNIQSYVEITKNQPIDMLVFWFGQVMECFTDKECLLIKKAFLKRVLNYVDVNAMDEDKINSLFLSLYNEIKLEIEQNCEKLM